jgi:hypothetical protein
MPTPTTLFALSGILLTTSLSGAVSSLWTQYEAAKQAGTATTLADFSYAGYRHGEAPVPTVDWKVYDVTDYGAVPDDGLSDKEAIRSAINAAEANGSGIVLFPKGRFCINEPDESTPWVNDPIVVQTGNIILRGSGSGSGGTELFAERHMNLASESKLYSAPFMLRFRGRGGSASSLDYVAAPVPRGSHVITVTNTPDFSEGDWVILELKDTRASAVAASVEPHAVEDTWTNLINNGVQIREIHQVASVGTDTITFKEPVQSAVPSHAEASHYARVIRFIPIEEVGIEDIAFVGNWRGAFNHHDFGTDPSGKKISHDSAWSALQFTNVVNGWIRDCRFTDWNYGISISSSATITVIRVKLDGNPGHTALTMNRSSHCFAGLVEDAASHHHACGVAGEASGNVFWKSDYASNTCFESHASQPRWTLFDAIAGGWTYGRWGGASNNLPNHMRGLVLWNYRNTGNGVSGDFHFMRPDSKFGRIIMPYVIGFHGNLQSFEESEIEVLESNGAPIEPASLYEAQYKLRTGKSVSMLMYQEWIARFNLTAPDNAPEADPDDDSIHNLLEYATGGNPASTTASHDIRADHQIRSEITAAGLLFHYPRRMNAAKLGLTYAMERSASLTGESWTSFTPEDSSSLDQAFELVTSRTPIQVNEPLFLRLKVEITK